MRIWVTGLVAALMAVWAASAEAPGEFPNVRNTSFVEPNGDRTIQVAITIAAPPDKVFEAFATPAGWVRWAVPFASGEARVGGRIETGYERDAKPGDGANIINEITAWIPNRLVVLKNVRAPDDFTDPDLFQKTATIIELTPDASGGTVVTISHVGFGAGPGFDQLYANFTWGNAYSLENLKRAIEVRPIDWTKQSP